MAYLEDVQIGAVVTVGYVNSEDKFKQKFVDWYEQNGWRLKEFHRGTRESRITITQLFPTEVGKNDGVNKVIKLVSQINREIWMK